MTTALEPKTDSDQTMPAAAQTTPPLGRGADSPSYEARWFWHGRPPFPCNLTRTPRDTDTAIVLLLFQNEELNADQGLQGMANADFDTSDCSPARASVARLLRLIHGRAIALKTRDDEHGLDDGVPRGQVVARHSAQAMFDMVKAPVVVCIGIAAYNLVQNLALSWQPAIVVARHTISWSSAYEVTLAQDINSLLLAVTQRSAFGSDGKAPLTATSANDDPLDDSH